MKDKLKNLYIIILLFYSGLSTEFFKSQNGIIALFVFSGIMAFIFKVKINKIFLYAFSVWVIYIILSYFSHGVFTPFFAFRNFVFIYVTYVVINIYRNRLTQYFEKYITILALISIVFYAWQMLSVNTLASFMNIFNVAGDIQRGSDYFYNILVYTLEINRGTNSILRNYGFCFEPGPFSIYLSLGILFNLMDKGIRFRENRNLIIMLIALLTTQSTTGYLAVGSLFVYISYKQNRSIFKYYIVAFLALGLVTLILYIPFLGDKIRITYESGLAVEQTLNRAINLNTNYSAGRFGGIILGWKDFIRFPLLGISGITELSYGRHSGYGIYMVNGIANIMSTFGLFGIIMYLIFLIKSSKFFSSIYGRDSNLGFVIVMLISLFSYSVHFGVLTFMFIFSSIFINKNYINYYQFINKQ